MRIALLQLNPTVGHVAANAGALLEAVDRASAAGAELCVAPEMVLTGYPPRDLLHYDAFIHRAAETADEVSRELPRGVGLILGLPTFSESASGNRLRNSALLLGEGRVMGAGHKTLLPSYDVFDEARYFEPWTGSKVVDFKGLRIALTVCEDLWNDKGFWERPRYSHDPLETIAAETPDLVVNISASPFSLGKQELRQRMLGRIAKRLGVGLVYVNQVGGNDDLVFDGRSMAFDAQGRLVARMTGFVSAERVLDANQPGEDLGPEAGSDPAEAFRAVVLGTRDYVLKSGFSRAVLGLSGGIDSSLCAVAAAKALGPESVTGILMPSPHTGRQSVDDALTLAGNLGMDTMTLPVDGVMLAYDQTLAGPFSGLDTDVAEENIQARIRGNLLMALSNKFGWMVLATGNKSELSVGYCTLYGDMAGGFAPLADVPKTLVYDMARWANREFGSLVPESVLARAPTAELRPGQTDQDVLPPYEVLDDILLRHIERNQSLERIVAAGHDPEVVARVAAMVHAAEFKRRQAPPGPKITGRAFGTGWRMPLAAKKHL